MNDCEMCLEPTMNRALTASFGGVRRLLCKECRWYEARLRKMTPAERAEEERMIMDYVAGADRDR